MLQKNQNSQKHIYLTDDDEDDRALFAEVLLELSSSVIITHSKNGKELMDILNRPPNPLPEVLFLDLNMPIKNGFECLEEIKKQNNPLQNLSIVVLTTSSDALTVDKAFKLGATFFAVKPNTFAGLKSLAHDILQIDWMSPPIGGNFSKYLISPANFKTCL